MRRGLGTFVGVALLALFLTAVLPLGASAAEAGWKTQTSGITDYLRAVSFGDASHGWAVGMGGAILATSDGGATWTPQASGTTTDLRGVSFTDANHGWVVGGGGSGIVLATSDGGATWVEQYWSSRLLYAVTSTDPSHGWAVGDMGTEGSIHATTNAGATWSAQAGLSSYEFFGVSFADSSHGWAAGYGTWSGIQHGIILATSNGGATWNVQYQGDRKGICAISFCDSSHGWAVGGGGLILVTDNGGATWSGQVSGTTQDLRGVSFTDANHGWAVGGSGLVLATVDGGVTWTAQNTGIADQLTAVCFTDSTHGWAVGSYGTVIATSSGGRPQYTIAVAQGSHGSVTPGTDLTVDYGATPTFRITPDLGYHVASVTVDGSPVSMTSTNQYTFPAVAADHTISVSFAIDRFTLTPSVTGGRGTISPVTEQIVDYGATPTFTLAPETGYHVSEVRVDGNLVIMTGTNEYTFPAVRANHEISVTFTTSSTFTITVAPVVHGSVAPGTTQVNLGSTPTFTFTPDPGYHVDEVRVDGNPVVTSANSFTFAPVTANHELNIEFAVDVVRPLLGTPTCPTSVRHGTAFKVNGSLKPRFGAGTKTVTVKAYRYASGKWRFFKSYSAVNSNYSSYTKYTAKIVISRRGKYRFKASMAATSTSLAATSRYSRTLTVK